MGKHDSEDYLPASYFVSWEQFTATREWLFPLTEEIDGVIFLSGRMTLNPEQRREAAHTFMKKQDLPSKEIVDSFNWVEVDGFIKDDIPEKEVKKYLDDLRVCWQWVIQARHPNHKIMVRILSPVETGGWYGVGFSQLENGAS